MGKKAVERESVQETYARGGDYVPALWPVTPLGFGGAPPPLPPLPDWLCDPSTAMPFAADGRPGLPTVPFDVGLVGCSPPPLPPLPDCAFGPTPQAPFSNLAIQRSVLPPTVDIATQEDAPRKEETWTPVADMQSKIDRRTFFHGEGKQHIFAYSSDGRRGRSGECVPLGTRIRLEVSEVHFGNARVRVMQGQPAPMPTMLKWGPDQFEEHTLECAQISFGDYWVWCAVGVTSNRLIYAAKRSLIEELTASVVAPPPVANPDEDIDLTYGASIQGIQLVP